MPIDAISATAHAGPAPITRAREEAKVTTAGRLAGWLESHAMFVIAVTAVLIISLMGIPQHLSQDGFLALIAGRLIAAHGIPQHDYFAVMTHGVHWVDQQWLAQLLMYELERIGGLQLLTVLYVLVTVVGFGGAVTAARRLGGEDLHVLMATVPGAFFYLVTAVSIRTQGFAYPLFVATLWLLASEVRSPLRRRRVYLIFPMLVLWANLHGSVTMGVGLCVLYGLVVLLSGVRSHGIAGLADARPFAFILLAPLTLLATPYGTGMIHYYKTTLLNSQFSRMVTEWKPVTSIIGLAIPLFVLIALTALVVVRQQRRAGEPGVRRPQLFDVLTLTVLATGAVMAVRNVTWFGLALVVLLPAAITQSKRGTPAPLRRARVNRLMAVATVALSLLVAVATLARPTNWFTSTYPAKSIPTLRALIKRDPNAKLLADVRYADWLIWQDPSEFAGRVAYDTSFELLRPQQLVAIADLAANTRNARDTVDDYRIWMLYPGNRSINKVLLHRPGVRVVSRTRKAIIAINGRGQV